MMARTYVLSSPILLRTSDLDHGTASTVTCRAWSGTRRSCTLMDSARPGGVSSTAR
jgi:hypothetical protein